MPGIILIWITFIITLTLKSKTCKDKSHKVYIAIVNDYARTSIHPTESNIILIILTINDIKTKQLAIPLTSLILEHKNL